MSSEEIVNGAAASDAIDASSMGAIPSGQVQQSANALSN